MHHRLSSRSALETLGILLFVELPIKTGLQTDLVVRMSFCKARLSLRGNLSTKCVYFQAISTSDISSHVDDVETVPVPIEVSVVVKHTATEDTVHGTRVTSDSRKNTAARMINLADEAFTDEPVLPGAALQVLDKTLAPKRGKLSK